IPDGSERNGSTRNSSPRGSSNSPRPRRSSVLRGAVPRMRISETGRRTPPSPRGGRAPDRQDSPRRIHPTCRSETNGGHSPLSGNPREVPCGVRRPVSLHAICPCVVRANEGPELFSVGHADDAGPSVPANVVKSADVSIVSSNEEQGLVPDFPNEKIPGVWDLIRATDIQPTSEIEPLEFFMECRLVPEGSPGQEGRC